ncbi:DUF2971 domain-containing protein [Paenibacillus sp. NPDC056579]|uniref:DUF2971 domain-containing protein n=1 Tax=Paenibacillus sp. NPDC056579 TaxID=3345871 RepID=UPI0036C07935
MNTYRNLDGFLEQIEEGILYHYTSATGLMGIIGNECLWVSKSNFLNDISEIDYINKLIIEIGKEMSLLSNILDMIMKEKSYIEYGSNGDVNEQNYYIFSLTTNGDSLTLWSSYSNFYGYNIGFEGTFLKEVFDNVPLSIHGKVIYNRDRQRELIKNEMEKYRAEIDKYTNNQSDENLKELKAGLNLLVVSLALFGIFFKDPCFSHEEEYRVVFFQHDITHEKARYNQKVLFRERNGTITPYIEVRPLTHNNKLPIKNITVGPKNNIDIAQNGLEFFLAKKGYIGIPVIRSSIPLRF